MACGTPCVVTDVGDSALIVENTGKVVAPNDPHALAEAWRSLIEAGPTERRRLGTAARARIREHFALPAIVQSYQKIYSQLDGPHAAKSGFRRTFTISSLNFLGKSPTGSRLCKSLPIAPVC